MAKGTYIYEPNNIYYWTNHELDSMDSFLKANGRRYEEAIKKFFSIPEVQKMVDTQEWGKLFKSWDEDEYIYGVDVLGSFLWLLGIDFMKDLEDSFVKRHFSLYNYANRTTGKGFMAYKE